MAIELKVKIILCDRVFLDTYRIYEAFLLQNKLVFACFCMKLS